MEACGALTLLPSVSSRLTCAGAPTGGEGHTTAVELTKRPAVLAAPPPPNWHVSTSALKKLRPVTVMAVWPVTGPAGGQSEEMETAAGGATVQASRGLLPKSSGCPARDAFRTPLPGDGATQRK